MCMCDLQDGERGEETLQWIVQQSSNLKTGKILLEVHFLQFDPVTIITIYKRSRKKMIQGQSRVRVKFP